MTSRWPQARATTRRTRDNEGQWRSAAHMRVPACRRFSDESGRRGFKSRRPKIGEAAHASRPRCSGVGPPQRRARAGAQVPDVHRCVSRDRRWAGRVAHNRGASADGIDLAVLERARAAGGAGDDANHKESAPHGNHVRRAKRYPPLSGLERRSLICRFVYSHCVVWHAGI